MVEIMKIFFVGFVDLGMFECCCLMLECFEGCFIWFWYCVDDVYICVEYE